MKNTRFLFATMLVAAWLGCGLAESNEQEQGPESLEMPADSTETAETAAGAPAYTIQVLNPDLPSPRKEMRGLIGPVSITINYGSPSVKGRKIFGELEPFGKVWRTGANEATTIEVSTDVLINGQPLAAGKYALFTIPGETKWTVIFNATAEQWGAYDYDEGKDVLRIEVDPVVKESPDEMLDFRIEGEQIVLSWDKTSVPFSVSQG